MKTDRVIASERSEQSNLQTLRLLRHYLVCCLAMTCFLSVLNFGLLSASEVIPETHSKVILREHPKTGKPYVVIAPEDLTEGTGFFPEAKKFSRPDYRLLDPKVKSGQIPYDGPYSDSKRIYIFAASLATLGAGGFVGAAFMPATGAAASGGGAYLAAGSAVAAGAAATATTSLRANSKKDNFTQASESKSIYKE